MAKITYLNKVKVQDIPVAEINKFTDANANEIKSVVNGLDDIKQNKLVEGAGIIIDDTDPLNPIIISTGGGVTDHTILTNIGVNTHPQIDAHISNITTNPHQVDKSDVGLSNVDNTSDSNKPISNATQTALNYKVDKNSLITASTKTKISYDSKGLVTNGTNATTADITDTLNKRYLTDANLVVINNTSGTNTGDETILSIQTKRPLKTINSTSIEGSGNIVISGSSQNLQQVTDIGNTTTNTITVNDGLGSSVNLYPSGILNLIAPGTSYFMSLEASSAQIGAYNGTNFRTILQFPSTTSTHTINIPNKSGTFALLDDITAGATHPEYPPRNITATGASVLSTFTSDAIGSVTGITTRTLTPTNIGAESSLGNPTVSGNILSSTTAGVRSWITPPTGGATNLSLSVNNLVNIISSDTGTDVSLNASTDSVAGLMTASTQTIGGAKTFTSNISAPDFIGTSDIRLKENIEELIPRKLNTGYKSFNFIKNKEEKRVGLIAQEVEIENPEFVRTDLEGMKSISYIDLHSEEIAYLKSKVEQLEAMLLLLLKK